MEKYMVGDEFGHMYYEDSDEFFSEKGTIYNSKESAEYKMEELSKNQEYSDRDWKFKVWTVILK